MALQSGHDIKKAYATELLELSDELAPTKRKMAFNICLGALSFIPNMLAGITTTSVDVGKQLKEYRDYSKTWLSFIQHAKDLAEQK